MKGTETVDIELKTREAGKAVAKFVGDIMGVAKSGGLLAGVGVVTSALNDLVPVLSDFAQVPTEAVEDPWAETTTAVLIGKDIYNALKTSKP